ncbi:MAG: hypothetical protein P4M15_10510 [Alphaproteobacteria bacterium]|nr:hypothetical protein [Alphaproteobacteria bacterium]
MNNFWSSALTPPYRGLPWLVLFYVLLSVFLLPGGGVVTGHLLGYDDQVRMVQVLDWINNPHGMLGGWYDRTITRTNAPEGFTTIWSRLVDIPIAAVIILAQQFVSQKTAALIAATIVPVIEIIILFQAAPYFARPLVGKNKARLIILFLIFTSLLNFKYFSVSGFYIGEASHHSWYIILNLLMMGAVARLVMGSSQRAPQMMLAATTALFTAVGIEGFPLIAGVEALIILLAWGYNRPRLAQRGAQGMMTGAVGSFLLLPLHQPPETLFTPSFAEPSILGPILLGAAGLFLFIEQAVLTRGGTRKAVTAFILAAVALVSAGALVTLFPQTLDGGAAGLSPAERKMALSQHFEAQATYKLAQDTVELIGLLAPSLIALAAAIYAVARSRGRKRAMHLCYLGFAAVGTGMSEIFSRYYHHAMTTACPWLLWAWERIKGFVRQSKQRLLYGGLAFVALGPLWMLILPVIDHQLPIVPYVLLFPAAMQVTADPCDSLSIANYIDDHYPPTTNLDVPSWNSAHFLYQADVHIDFLSNFPSQDKFIDNFAFFDTANAERAHAIALRHKVDLVAVCAIPSFYDPHKPEDAQSMLARLQAGHPPVWLQQLDTAAIETNFLLYAVVK